MRPAQGVVDHLVLLHAAFAAKALRSNHGRVMVIVVGQGRHFDVASGQRCLDQSFDFAGGHRHQVHLS